MNPEQPQHQPTPIDYSQPVAYDINGQPLYAHPPVAPAVETQPTQPQVVHVMKSPEPARQEVSIETKAKHDQSKRLYPTLNLSDGEYVIRAVRRHPIGLFAPIGVGIVLLALTLALLFNYAEVADSLQLTGALADASGATVPILLFALLIGLGMFIAYYVYINNKFFLTNESVIQETQISLFSRNEQTVSLANIEDASFVQHGILQQLINYGSIRLSTEGDETTYRFNYVANPKDHIATLNNAVEAFKNGRPVDDGDN